MDSAWLTRDGGQFRAVEERATCLVPTPGHARAVPRRAVGRGGVSGQESAPGALVAGVGELFRHADCASFDFCDSPNIGD